MPIQKKKKKEEFDASLMGGYLPGTRPVLSPSIVARTQDVLQITPTPPSTVTFLEMSFPERLNYQMQNMGLAWSYYAFGGGPFQLATQTPQAWGAYKFGVYPSFKTALIYELGWGTVILATLHTILDPHRVWRAPFTEKVDPQFINPQQVPEGMVRGGYL